MAAKNGEAIWYKEHEAIDLARHVGKRLNEGVPIAHEDIAGIVLQLRGAIDKISMLEQFHYDMMNPETGEFVAMAAILKEWGIGPYAEPPIKIKTKTVGPFEAFPQDTMNVSYTPAGDKPISLRAPIGRAMTVDTLTIFAFKDALGFTNAIAGVVGKSE